MTSLLTITRLDHVKQQVQGERQVRSHTDTSVMPNTAVDQRTGDRYRAIALELYPRLAAGVPEAFHVVDEQVRVFVDDDASVTQGIAQWQQHWQHWREAFDGLTVQVNRSLQDGHRVALAYTISGRHTGAFVHSDRTEHEASAAEVSVDVIDFLEFGEQGTITEVVSVFNPDDIVAQITS